MYISGNKKHTVKARDKTVDLKKTKDLYGRLMVLARSNRGIEKKQAVACLGEYACTQDPIHYHGKNRKKCHILSHLCDKKHHPLRVSWC